MAQAETPRDYLQPGDVVDDRYRLGEALDESPNARGGFAHVVRAQDQKRSLPVAFKVMWPSHADDPNSRDRQAWYSAFAREADLLVALRDDPRVAHLHDFGFLCPSSVQGSYSVRRPEPGTPQGYRTMMTEAREQRWRPFLVLDVLDPIRSLHRRIVRQNHHGGSTREQQFVFQKSSVALPMIEAMEIALQVADFLVDLHAKRIIYYDGKPAHLYWDGVRVRFIDLNVSFRVGDPDLNSTGITAKDAFVTDVVIAARTFVYPAFVGLDWETGHAPASEGTRSAATPRNQAAMHWRGKVDLWGQEARLDSVVVSFLRRAVQSGEFKDAEAFRHETRKCAAALGWEFEGLQPNAKAKRALPHKRQALEHLRQALDQFRLAEECLGQAIIFDSKDTEILDIATRDIRSKFEEFGL